METVQIYIEYYFLLNFVFMFCVWELVSLVLSCTVTQEDRRGSGIWCRIKASFIGALISCVCFMLPLMMWYRLVTGFLLASFISIRMLAGKWINRKQYIKYLVTAFEMGILLGGMIVWIQRFILKRDFSMTGLVAISVGMTLVMRLVMKRYLLPKKKIIYKAELVFEGKRYSLSALLDTGNSLVEPISKKAVCLIGKEYFEKQWEKDENSQSFSSRKFRAIPYHAVGTENGILYGYEMDLLLIETEERKIAVPNPMIGISDWSIGSQDTYQMILHPKLLIEGE